MKFEMKTLCLSGILNTASFLIFFLLIFSLIGCHNNDRKEVVKYNIPDSANNGTSNDLNLENEIDLYPYDTIFNQFLPDTSLVFNSNKPLKEYLFEKYRLFDSAFNKWESKDTIQTFVIKRTAQILYDDNAQAIRFKYFKTRKDNLSLTMLSDYSPFSRLITLDDRLSEFNNYPIKMQRSQLGEKAINQLKRYEFKNNIGRSFDSFFGEEIITTDEKKVTLKTLLHKEARYYIFVFGASWCGACIIEERMLKYWNEGLKPFKIQIVGLSVDDNMKKWKKYIDEENYPWDAVLLPKEFRNKLSSLIDTGNGIPMNLLVDNNGTILAQNTDIRRILEAIPELKVEQVIMHKL